MVSPSSVIRSAARRTRSWRTKRGRRWCKPNGCFSASNGTRHESRARRAAVTQTTIPPARRSAHGSGDVPGLAAAGVQPARLALVAVIGIAIWVAPHPAGVDPRAWHLLAVFIAMPLGAMTLIAIAVALVTRTLTVAEALSGFSNSTVWLVVAAFFLAAGFTRTGLGPRIAYGLVALFGRRTIGLGYSLVASDLILAPAIASNTARAAGVMFPVLKAIAESTIKDDPGPGRKTAAFLTLVAYQGTVITSAMFLTAMVANPLVVQLAAAQGIVITWVGWAQAALVPGLVSL
ncbi:MAG: hypothetical protein E6J45_13755, partial [Chloroflexi bacterium]